MNDHTEQVWFCPACGHQNQMSFKHCPQCGASIPTQQPYTQSQNSGSTSHLPQEYRRTCQACGKVWHSLVSREQDIQRSSSANSCNVLAQMCNPSAQLQASRNLDANKSEIARLRQCPNCNSAAYIEEIVTHVAPPSQ